MISTLLENKQQQRNKRKKEKGSEKGSERMSVCEMTRTVSRIAGIVLTLIGVVSVNGDVVASEKHHNAEVKRTTLNEGEWVSVRVKIGDKWQGTMIGKGDGRQRNVRTVQEWTAEKRGETVVAIWITLHEKSQNEQEVRVKVGAQIREAVGIRKIGGDEKITAVAHLVNAEITLTMVRGESQTWEGVSQNERGVAVEVWLTRLPQREEEIVGSRADKT
jgi:hypothetical protein